MHEIENVLVEDVELFSRRVLLQQFACHFSFSSEDDSIFGEDSQSCASMGDGFKGIFNLVETAFGGEDGGLEGQYEISSVETTLLVNRNGAT